MEEGNRSLNSAGPLLFLTVCALLGCMAPALAAPGPGGEAHCPYCNTTQALNAAGEYEVHVYSRKGRFVFPPKVPWPDRPKFNKPCPFSGKKPIS